MSRTNFWSGVVLALFIGVGASSAASVAAVDTPNGSLFAWRDIIGANQSATIGWSFQVGAQDLQLTALGAFDDAGDGLEDAHPVGIWTSGGVLLKQVTVPSGTGGTLVGSYRYLSVSPVTLTAGQTYMLGEYFAPVVDRCGTACGDASGVFGSQTFAPGVTFVQSRQNRAIIGPGSLAFPNLDAEIAQSFFGPNFLMTTADPISSPEPASWGLAAVGVVALAASRGRKNMLSFHREVLRCVSFRS